MAILAKHINNNRSGVGVNAQLQKRNVRPKTNLLVSVSAFSEVVSQRDAFQMFNFWHLDNQIESIATFFKLQSTFGSGQVLDNANYAYMSAAALWFTLWTIHNQSLSKLASVPADEDQPWIGASCMHMHMVDMRVEKSGDAVNSTSLQVLLCRL